MDFKYTAVTDAVKISLIVPFYAFTVTPGSPAKETTWGPLEEVIAVGFAYTFKISARDRFGTLITTHSDVSAFSLRFDGRGFHSSTFTLS
jgi:hypothetical protein